MVQAIPSDSARLFIALWPNQAIRDALLRYRERWTWANGTYLAHANSLHITLHFLGNLPLQTIPALIDALHAPFEPFDLVLSQSTVWRNGIAVLEPDVIPVTLTNLHAELGEALHAIELPLEARRYRPHVTFARRAVGSIAPTDCSAIRWSVNGYALMRSHLSSSLGYQVLHSYG